MKKFLVFAIALLSAGITVKAQIPDFKKATQGVTGMATPGKLLTQFTDAIKPTSFLSSWSDKKSGWLGEAGKISSAVSMAQTVSSLIGFIKPGAFKSGFNVQNLLQTANTVKTMGSAAGLLKNLEGGLKPESLSDSWGSEKSRWMSALNMIK